MTSLTHGKVTLDEMFKIIQDYIQAEPDKQYHITIGTDSQNFNVTRTVLVVAVHRVGHGGIFFFDVMHVPKIQNIKQKIWFETTTSIELATQLNEKFEQEDFFYGITIHVDAGYNGPTSKVIPEITAYVKACGFDCEVKPESYTASAIANKFTKVRRHKRKRALAS
jgi:predicted RNase H-related nuclease YkuK (DUF458 family)